MYHSTLSCHIICQYTYDVKLVIDVMDNAVVKRNMSSSKIKDGRKRKQTTSVS